jgi:hypothetical protein
MSRSDAIAPAATTRPPPGSRGYDDLRRDAIMIGLAENLRVQVASMIDLTRIAEASTGSHDRARLPALRATLELATTSAAGDAAAA